MSESVAGPPGTKEVTAWTGRSGWWFFKEKGTIREQVSQELEALLFLEREAFIEENGGRNNSTYPRRLGTLYSQVKPRVPRDGKARFQVLLVCPLHPKNRDLADFVIVLYSVRFPSARSGRSWRISCVTATPMPW
ncbi:MAG: hypothetical protein QXP01_05505 [Candidatus Hadarchaeum sp.]